jgi:hypothetical protein
MRATLTDETARVVQEPTSESISLTSLRKGEEFEIGKVIRKKKEVWVTVTTSSGVKGYISGDTHIFAIQKVEAIGNDLDVYAEPGGTSEVVTIIPKRTLFTVRGVEKVDDEDWYFLETDEGVKGYFKAGVKLRAKPEVTRDSARKMMVTGGLFAAAGVVLYFVNAANQTTAGQTDFLTLGLILLGLFQVFQGYMQYRQATKKENNK